ncbi:hypothetical protein [Terrimonas alba]|uniref:hypothetical protein n=1 Tax=Terrimonas alba TaxID=3349636 RepID=UPI0035F2B2DD
MKNFIYTVLLLLLYDAAVCQDLIIKGRIRCINQTPNSTKGAENIVVVPTFMPSRSAITASSPSGYFEFNTKTDLQKLQDKQVNINIISRCSNCKDMVKRVFISEDQDRQNRDDSKSYVTIKKWMVEKNCKEVELSSFKADSVLNVVMKQPDVKLSELGNATAVAGTPALLNLLTTLTTVLVPVPPATGIFQAVELREGQISYGQFLFASPLTHTASTGFNFSPARDLSESVFWNPSALVNSKKQLNINFLTNVKNNGKLNGFFKITDKVYLGVGGIYTRQDEFRDGDFKSDPTDPTEVPKFVDSLTMKLKEYAVYISPAYKINNQLSVGLSAKSIWQDFNIPNTINIQQDQDGITSNTFTFNSVKKQRFDVDVSVSYKVSKQLQVGLNAMNLAGTKLYADAFVPGQENIFFQNQRSFGLGLCYKWQRFNFGADLLFTEDDFYDAAFGVNYVPFNDALISAGIAVKQLSYSFAIRLKHFRLAYIDDNDFLINEKRKGKSGVLNGRLYGGFAFSF